jgi:hypothetical protein
MHSGMASENAERAMPHVWRSIEEYFEDFRFSFSRDLTYEKFVLNVLGMAMRTDKNGVSSTIRVFDLNGDHYKLFLHFYRSDGYTLEDILDKRIKIAMKSNELLYRMGGRPTLIVDGVKQAKEGLHMPCVNKLCQQSGDTSKKTFIYGLLYGCTSILIGDEDSQFAFPLVLHIQGSEYDVRKWIKEQNTAQSFTKTEPESLPKHETIELPDGEEQPSHVVLNIRDACSSAVIVGEKCYCVGDAYYLSGPVLNELKNYVADDGEQLVDLITRGRKDCVGYRQNGKRVKLIHLMDVFEDQKDEFKEVNLNLYGEDKKVLYYSEVLSWNRDKKYRRELLFVFTQIGDNKIFICTTDLNMDPLEAIRIYSKRFKIETGFRCLKHEMGGLDSHFWTAAMTKISKKSSAEQNRAALRADAEVSEKNKKLIINAFLANEGFANISAIAMGLLQDISLKYDYDVKNNRLFKVTHKKGYPSETDVASALRKSLPYYIELFPNTLIALSIKNMQKEIEKHDIDE